MRDPNRINRIIETIRRVWHLVPDWRLGQLICNLSRDIGEYDSFFTEDDRLDMVARAWLKANQTEAGGVEFIIHRENYPTFMDAVKHAISECDGQNFEIRANKDGTFDLIYEPKEDDKA